MKYIFFCLVSLVFLSSCAMPTTRHPNIPTVDSYDMKDVRRELRRYSYQLSTQRRQRLGEIAYNLRKSTGQEMCDRKLLADIGVDFMRINRLNVWKWSASYDALKEEHDDAQMLYGRNVGEVWIEGVYKGSAAEKAGVKKGDRLVSINGMLISKEDDNNEVFNIIYEQMYKSGNGIPIELELERNGKSKKYSFEPDMVCPYYIGVNDTSPDINAYATGDSIIMTARMMDYVSDDTALAAVVAHELAHNVLGHRESKGQNMLIGALIGAAIDVSIGGDGSTMDAAAVVGWNAYSQEYEMEADHVGLYLLARAGYDYHKAGDMQKLLGALSPMDIYVYESDSTHPSSSKRLALARETAKEIDMKLALGDKRSDLVPDFKKTNKHLKNKTDITKDNGLW